MWKSDGTAAGTLPVKKNISGWNTPESFIAAGTLFYFTLQPYGSNDPDVWRSDGTDAGTVLAADINPGAGHANPTGMVNLGKDILFIADTDAHGRQLWHTSPAVTAVEDPLVASSIAVYPNPTDGEVTLRLAPHLTGPVTISTLDLTGKVLQSETIQTRAGVAHTVHLGTLPSGLYLLRITGAKGTITKKFIKR